MVVPGERAASPGPLVTAMQRSISGQLTVLFLDEQTGEMHNRSHRWNHGVFV